jgi:tRNA (pseudouridine54-N1)-methyltransferase
VRRIVVVCGAATASPSFSLEDIPGTSGRIDVAVRCLRAALLVSHGVRQDTVAYLVLLGGPDAPRTIRVDGATAKFLRPDERSLATLVKKTLALATDGESFVTVKPGVAIASGGVDAVLADVSSPAVYVLEESAPDIRDATLDRANAIFFVGDHRGFDDAVRARLASLGAVPLSVGPVSVHAEDAVTLLVNELDRSRRS